jgi:peptidoglycan/LPS O-acetylase OafA/YrhL
LLFFGLFFLLFRKRENKILNFFGNISYPLYLTHTPLGWVLLDVFYNKSHSLVISYFGAIAIVVFISYLLHLFIEKPCINFAKNIICPKLKPYKRKRLA